MNQLLAIARFPVPQGVHHVGWLAVADAVVFMTSQEWVAHSLVDGRTLWRRSGQPYGAQILGSNSQTFLVQEMLRHGTNRWIEGVDVGTGETRWRKSESPPFVLGMTFGDHVHGCGINVAVKISLETGAFEPSVAMAGQRGPGGSYRVDKKRLLRFDGASMTSVCDVAGRLAVTGIAGGYAVLAKSVTEARSMVVVDLETLSSVTVELGAEDHCATTCGETLVISARQRGGDTLGIDPRAVFDARARTIGPLALADVEVRWRRAGAHAIGPRLGACFLATSFGIVDGRDGAILVEDAGLDRAVGALPHVAAWSMSEKRGEEGAIVFREDVT